MPITVTVSNTYGAVNILTDWASSPVVTGITLYRQTPDGLLTAVRGSPVLASGGQAVWWDDEAPLNTTLTYITGSTEVTGTQISSTCIITGGGGDLGWLKDPVIPLNDIQLSMKKIPITTAACVTGAGIFLSGFDAETFDDDDGSFPVINDSRNTVVVNLRKSFKSGMTLTSLLNSDARLLSTIFASGRVLLLQLTPETYGWALNTYGSDYIHCGDVKKQRPPLRDLRRSVRIWDVPFEAGKSPAALPALLTGSNNVGVGRANYYTMNRTNMTYQALTATARTYAQLAQGLGY